MNLFMNMFVFQYNAPVDLTKPEVTPEPTAAPAITRDPMSIIGGGVIEPAKNIDPVDYLWTDALYYAVTNFTTTISVSIVIALFITMLFVNKSEKLAERKQDILHKLLIVFLASSLISILNFALQFSRYIFAMK